MTYFVEVRPTVKRTSAPRLAPLDTVNEFTGFRSVYGYLPETAQHITETGSTRDLRGEIVYSDKLFVDFDNTDPSAMIEWLIAAGIGFEIYNSGNRSTHLHVDIEPMLGAWVPAAQKAWMRTRAPTADMTFYHAAGQYRLPRTFHSKTGRAKELVKRHDGQALVINQAPAPVFTIGHSFDESSQERLFQLLSQSQGVGGRSRHLWLIATTCARLGMSFDEACSKLAWWNDNMSADNPHTTGVLVRQCESAYQQVLRSAIG